MADPNRIAFGAYKPDQALLVNDGLAVARNTVPIHGGYDGINSLASISGFTAITGATNRPRGAIAGIDRRGNPFNFVGTQEKLYSLRSYDPGAGSATVDATRSTGGAYNCSGEKFWEFVVFRDHIIAVNPNDDSQYYTLGVDTNFKRLGNPDTTNTVAPRAAHVGLIGTFVVMGNTYDGINGKDESAIHWSAVNDPFNWPDPGTEVALAVQSDRQPLAGDGGAVQRIVSGSEVGAIFQESSIWRADYRGGDAVFELNRVEPERGLLIPAIAVPFGRQVFYLAEDGFYLFDYTESVSIGREIIDKTFLDDVDRDYTHRISATKDPNSQRIWILYAGSGHTNGDPNKYLCYDYGLQRWSHGDLDAEWITQTVHVGLSLDALHTAADPNTDAIDDVGGAYDPLPSFDDRIANYGAGELGAWVETSADNWELQSFTGTARAAVLETARRELDPGYRSKVRSARVLVDAVDPTIEVAGTGSTRATPRFKKPQRQQASGDAGVRSDGRYHIFRVNLPTGFSNALGIDVVSGRSGTR